MWVRAKGSSRGTATRARSINAWTRSPAACAWAIVSPIGSKAAGVAPESSIAWTKSVLNPAAAADATILRMASAESRLARRTHSARTSSLCPAACAGTRIASTASTMQRGTAMKMRAVHAPFNPCVSIGEKRRLYYNFHSMHVLGIDAGGTKTICLLADGEGQIIGEARGGGANLQAAGELEVEKVLHHVMDAAIGDRDVRPVAICLGMAGVDRPADTAAVHSIMRRIGSKAQVIVVNDALVALVAGAGDGEGVVVVAWTGVGPASPGAAGRAPRARRGGGPPRGRWRRALAW